VLGRQVNDRSPMRLREGLYRHDERVGTLLDGGMERPPYLLRRAHVEQL
jgi:hypothetical protein